MQQATYAPNKDQLIVVGSPTLVDVISHPTCSNCTVRTTAVKEYNEATGIFITDNTVFTPIEQPPTVAQEPAAPPAVVTSPSKLPTIKEIKQ